VADDPPGADTSQIAVYGASGDASTGRGRHRESVAPAPAKSQWSRFTGSNKRGLRGGLRPEAPVGL